MPRYLNDIGVQTGRSAFAVAPVSHFLVLSAAGSLQTFVANDDEQRFGKGTLSLKSISELINLHVINDFNSVSALEAHIENLDLLNPVHLRPEWDMYFMVSLTILQCNI